jgi:hypothetical protein
MFLWFGERPLHRILAARRAEVSPTGGLPEHGETAEAF